MKKDLFFFIAFLACLWLILDEFVGEKRISYWAQILTVGMGGLQ